MSIDQLTTMLSPLGVSRAVKWAKENGHIHHANDLTSKTLPIRRVTLHMNDDGSSFIVLHETHFNGTETGQEPPHA